MSVTMPERVIVDESCDSTVRPNPQPEAVQTPLTSFPIRAHVIEARNVPLLLGLSMQAQVSQQVSQTFGEVSMLPSQGSSSGSDALHNDGEQVESEPETTHP